MIRKLVLPALLLASLVSYGQLQSPDQFLGYRTGTRFTPHYRIIEYFRHVATSSPEKVKYKEYGRTNEGRPLVIAIISSPENIRNIESIRMNNLRLANMAKDKMAAVEDKAPAIVWLSYNVHGNEASSSEAAMMALYALVDPTNVKSSELLKQTVVIIDPCINPDGRDRYVNWFNSVSGKNPDPNRIAREHNEPWPGGRTNHYNFDLNRDWAWQTQIESKQRLALYHKWMPQVHVDFHEQGINSPYYFAPAAEPFHEVISPWQREFQNIIGRNHARYFDANGWLYFTKEEFDLFYPSYGDTWPIYNGAIGMTYEQAGHSGAGLAVINGDRDTLTLYDRAIHHFTTSMSTVEVAAQQAQRLIREFHKYFSDAVNSGVGEYKSYVIKYDDKNRERIVRMLRLLDSNNINYGTGSGSGHGFNYATGKEENFTFGAGDIIIPSQQPQSALLKVLMEPRSKLVDSVTYDITAWSVPYSYGLTCFASHEKILPTAPVQTAAPLMNPSTTYGYVIPWTGIAAVRLAGQLLSRGILLRYAQEPFEVSGNKFDRGSILVLPAGNQGMKTGLMDMTRKLADEAAVKIFPVSTGFVDAGYDFGSGKVSSFRSPRIILITGEGINSGAAGEVWYLFDQELDYPVSLVNQNDWSRINLNDVDVIIMPDGNYRFLADKIQSDAFKSWISKGGRVVAMEGAVLALSRAEFGIKLKKNEDGKKDSSSYDLLKRFSERERDQVTGSIPGSIFKVDLDNTHPLAFGYPPYYYTLKQDDNIYEFFGEGGWNVGVIKKDNQVAGFVGTRLKNRLKDGLLFGVQQIGNGSISYFADDVLFRSFWENGKLMFCNAVFLVGNN
jgi:hypothetical protein